MDSINFLYMSMFAIMFSLIFGIFCFIIIKNIATWNKNNHSPLLSVPAAIISKRMNISHHQHAGTNMPMTSSTTYYIAFQFDTSSRLELVVPGDQYGYLAEGDRGILTFQGTRYIGFQQNGTAAQKF